MGKEYKHLSKQERDMIAVYKAEGLKPARIAEKIGRDRSTICRELKRNAAPINKGYYLSHKAQERVEKRMSLTHTRQRLKNQRIREYVEEKIKEVWSPELIAGRIGKDLSGERISHEAIYQYIYEEKRELIQHLVRAYKKRKKRGYSRKHSKSHIPDRVSITERPKEVNKRIEPGHWEADSVVSRQSKTALNVITERKSRLTRISIIKQKTAACTDKAIKKALSIYPAHIRKTITYDNGSENVFHMKTNKALGTNSYFCNAYHSWEKGSAENRIGVIRWRLPKKTDFSKISKATVAWIENWLNNRPMKCLNYATPNEVFNEFVALKG